MQVKRDDNRVPALLAVSDVDGITPVALYADPSTHALIVEAGISLTASDIQIGAVEIKDGASDVRQTVLDLTNSNPAAVAIVDSSGDQISSFGGGTQYTEGDTDASITGTALLWEDAGNTLTPASASKPFPVEIIAGAGSGGTAAADDADFTAGTTSGTPAMGVYESTPTSVTDGDLGTVGITQGRRLKTSATIDAALPAGTNNIGDVDILSIAAGDNNIGNVDVASSALPTGASTSAKQDTIIGHLDGVEGLLTTIDGDTGTLAGAVSGSEVQVDVVAALPAGTNNIGDVDVFSNTAKDGSGTRYQPIVDADGHLQIDVLSGGGGGTQYTEGDTDASITGTALLFEGAADTLIAAPGTAANGLDVDVTRVSGTVTVDGSGVTQPVSNAGLTELAAAIGGTNANQLDVYIKGSAVATGGTSAADDDDFTDGTTPGTPAMGVYESTPSTVTDGDLGLVGITQDRQLKVKHTDAIPVTDNGGALTVDGTVAVTNAGLTALNGAISGTEVQVDVLTMPTVTVNAHAVTNAGTFAVQVDGNALTALQLIDDAVYVDDADWTDDTSKHLLVGGVYQSTQHTVTDGDVSPIALDANGNVRVRIMASVSQAVTNAGTFAVQVDGSALTALQLIDDPVATLGTTTYTETTTKGMIIGAIRRDADTTLVDTTNEVAPLQVDANGRLKVEAFSGETLPVSVSGVSTVAEQQTQTTHLATIAGDTTAIETAIQIMDDWDESDRAKVNIIAGQAGVAAGVGAVGATVPRIVQANDSGKTLASTGGSASSAGNNTLVAAGTNKLKVYAFSLSTTSTTAVTCIFQSGAGGTELWRCILQAPSSVSTGANLVVQPPSYLFSTASATLLNLNLSAAVAVHWSVSYFDEA